MPYEVPRGKASIGQNRFTFTMPGSEVVHSVPLLKYLRPALVLQAEDLSEVAFIRVLFAEYLPDVFDQFEDAEQLTAFMEAWQAASGVDVGESGASPS